jgi:hypothetical protein
MLLSAVVAAIVATTTPSPAPTTRPNVTWNTITLGAPSAQLRSVWGDPLAVSNVGDAKLARYLLPGTQASYVFVFDRSGQIAGFATFGEPDSEAENIPPDPSNVRLGETFESAKAKHPEFELKQDDSDSQTLEGSVGDVRVSYRVVKDRITAISWIQLSGAPTQVLPGIENPAGDSFDDAILDVQASEMAGTTWEYRYLAFHPCAENSRWKLAKQSLAHNAGRAYDILHVVCPATNAERDFYFDITPYFGKL